MEKEKILLNNHQFPPILLLGSGNMRQDNALRIDINSRVQPDILHDLDSFPYPFPGLNAMISWSIWKTS